MAVFDSLLNRSFESWRQYRVADGQGGFTRVWSLTDTFLGRMCPASGTERVIAQSEEYRVTHVLYTLTIEDVERGDVIEDGELVWEVLGVLEPSHSGHHWEIDCEERQDLVVGEVGS